MRSDPRAFAIAILLTALPACTARYVIRSDPPDATVTIFDPEAAEPKKLGATPMEIPAPELQALAPGGAAASGAIELQFSRPEYRTERILVPLSRFGTTTTTIHAKLLPIGLSGESTQAREWVKVLYTAQRLSNRGEFEKAHQELERILKIDPKFPRALSMRGSIYYVQKKYPDAIRWFEEALRADPTLDDVVVLLAEVKKRSGGRK